MQLSFRGRIRKKENFFFHEALNLCDLKSTKLNIKWNNYIIHFICPDGRLLFATKIFVLLYTFVNTFKFIIGKFDFYNTKLLNTQRLMCGFGRFDFGTMSFV